MKNPPKNSGQIKFYWRESGNLLSFGRSTESIKVEPVQLLGLVDLGVPVNAAEHENSRPEYIISRC